MFLSHILSLLSRKIACHSSLQAVCILLALAAEPDQLKSLGALPEAELEAAAQDGPGADVCGYAVPARGDGRNAQRPNIATDLIGGAQAQYVLHAAAELLGALLLVLRAPDGASGVDYEPTGQ